MLILKHEEALANGWRTDFDPARPWNMVWETMIEGMGPWWWKHVGKPALCISSGKTSVHDYADGDAPIAARSIVIDSHTSTTSSRMQEPPPKSKRVVALPYYDNGVGVGYMGSQHEQHLSEHDGTRYSKTQSGA